MIGESKANCHRPRSPKDGSEASLHLRGQKLVSDQWYVGRNTRIRKKRARTSGPMYYKWGYSNRPCGWDACIDVQDRSNIWYVCPKLSASHFKSIVHYWEIWHRDGYLQGRDFYFMSITIIRKVVFILNLNLLANLSECILCLPSGSVQNKLLFLCISLGLFKVVFQVSLFFLHQQNNQLL